MAWNYRVIHAVYHPGTEKEEHSYDIREVYYNEDGEPWAVTANGSEPYGETLEELAADLAHMQRALTMETLELKDFEGGGKYYGIPRKAAGVEEAGDGL